MSINEYIKNQPIINIGCLGSVSDGKSTLVAKLTGIKPNIHSDELKRNITINQGYGNLKIFNTDKKYHTTDSTGDDSNGELINHISFVDCPGHHELIKTMLASIVLMDGAIVVVAVNSPLSQKKQLKQHLAAIKLGKIKKIIICMNKIDLLKSKETLLERKLELDKMLIEYDIKPFAIIPTCFNKKIGLETVVKAIVELFNPDEYINRVEKDPFFRISRSFDINKSGIDWDKTIGGVIGGSLFAGNLSINDKIEIRPGQVSKDKNGKYICEPIITSIISIKTDTTNLTDIIPGGLIGLGTTLDPYYCKNNKLTGQVVGKIGTLPEIFTEITLIITIITLFDFEWIPQINDNLLLQIGTQLASAKLIKISDNKKYICTLSKPTCISNNQHIIICHNKNNVINIVGESYSIL